MTRALPYVWYPLFMTASIALFGAMLAAEAPLALALYTPIVIAARATLVLQARFPERQEWRPRSADVKNDLAFIAVVQVLLPQMFAAFALLAAANWMHENSAGQWWPHSWPLTVQVIVMLLIVDFLRYWVHRGCHHFPALWKLHEVHHSPEILYSLNTARFHPFEKALHFSADTLPFLLLGVSPWVIAGYFLVYAVNGFFQHSNVRLRYGFLNYIVGSAETHRWHHARDPRIALCNFGSSTVIWDLLFGTWFLAKDRVIDDIGIPDRAYPRDFWAQMLTPFRNRGASLRSVLAAFLIKLQLVRVRWLQGRRIARMARDPMRAQNSLLARLVRENEQTLFGREHRFDEIRGYQDFVERVPVREYEALRPFIDAEIERGESALTAEQPIWYMRTSGTTGKPKDIPLTASHLAALKRIQRTAVAFQHRVCPQAFEGGILAITSPAREGILGNGKFFGSASGVVAGSTPALIRRQFVVPPEVLTITDSRVKYLLILRLALARPDMTWLGTANATTLLNLIKLYREHSDELIKDVETGGFFLIVPDEVRAAVRSRLKADPARAAVLRARKMPRIADLWPNLRLAVTWTCASGGVAVSALREELSPATRVLELGYVASEFRGTFTIGKRAGSGFPTLDTHFFEFVERDAYDCGAPEYLTLDRIYKGVEYYIIVTTPSGLYRYFMNDLVRVTGFLHRMPLLKFVQKGKGVTNITGEKLYESQVLAAVSEALDERALRFMMMLADENERRYRLYLELDGIAHDAERLIDAKLMVLNIEYRAKRESARLGALQVVMLRAGAGEAYKQFCIERGQREGQFKSVALAYRRNFDFNLDAFAQ